MNSLRFFMIAHRIIGLAAALFVVMFSVTGIMLNHSRDWGLHHVNVSSEWMMEWYGIPEPIITLERVVTDIHSGRFFGVPGPYFMDLAAVSILFLVITGMALWWMKR